MAATDRREVRRWIFAFLGRLLYENGSDSHQTLLFFKGGECSGKSTIAKVMQSIHLGGGTHITDPQAFSNSPETSDARFVVHTGVRADGNRFDVEATRKAVANEPIDEIGLVKTNVLWCGYELPANMNRVDWLHHLLVFPMDRRIEAVNSHMDEDILRSAGSLTVKMVRAYRHLLGGERAQVDIWSNEPDDAPLLPQYLRMQSSEVWQPKESGCSCHEQASRGD